MTPTRRTLLGAAGAAALSRILVPWKPQPSDLLLADETPSAAAKPEAVEIPPMSGYTDTATYPTDGWLSLADDRGRVFATVRSMEIRREFVDATLWADGGWKRRLPEGPMQLRLDAFIINQELARLSLYRSQNERTIRCV